LFQVEIRYKLAVNAKTKGGNYIWAKPRFQVLQMFLEKLRRKQNQALEGNILLV
jgi:hypothetical protein